MSDAHTPPGQAASPAAKSIQVFGVYAMGAGLLLLLSPNTLLGLAGMPATTDFWVRVVGTLAFVVGYYYWACGRAGAVAFFRASIAGRLLFSAACLGLVLLAGAHAPLLMFAAVDLLGALWTAWALRENSRQTGNAAH